MIMPSLLAAVAAATLALSPAPDADPTPEVWMPSIDLYSRVYFGKQGALDRGLVVLPQWGGISDRHGGTYNDSCLPSWGCTVWLAGHRATHGSVFRNVPNLEPGDVVTIKEPEGVFEYEIIDVRAVSNSYPAPQMFGWDLIIQTSWYNSQVMMAFGTRI